MMVLHKFVPHMFPLRRNHVNTLSHRPIKIRRPPYEGEDLLRHGVLRPIMLEHHEWYVSKLCKEQHTLSYHLPGEKD